MLVTEARLTHRNSDTPLRISESMTQIETYLEAASRESTRRSYASAVRHFEVEWKGLLPATSEMVARYLADHAATLSLNTLQHRLSALSRWHTDHGFTDPTKAQVVRQVLRGIRTLHPAREKQAKPLQLDTLQRLDSWLQQAAYADKAQVQPSGELRHLRDRALLLLGFWRGFRADELVRLRIEHIEIEPGEGLTCFLPRSKGDRNADGRTFRCPALSRLCPVSAYADWLTASGLTAGPVFRAIDRWGNMASAGLSANGVIPIIRGIFASAGIPGGNEYSSHSLRRGFAGWAKSNGWDIKELMEYVGWRDLKSAVRYLEIQPGDLKQRFERGLPSAPEAAREVSAVHEPSKSKIIRFPAK